jgi:hypothetical protein
MFYRQVPCLVAKFLAWSETMEKEQQLLRLLLELQRAIAAR